MVQYLSVTAAVILAALLAFAVRALVLAALDRPQRRSLVAFRILAAAGWFGLAPAIRCDTPIA